MRAGLAAAGTMLLQPVDAAITDSHQHSSCPGPGSGGPILTPGEGGGGVAHGEKEEAVFRWAAGSSRSTRLCFCVWLPRDSAFLFSACVSGLRLPVTRRLCLPPPSNLARHWRTAARSRGSCSPRGGDSALVGGRTGKMADGHAQYDPAVAKL